MKYMKDLGECGFIRAIREKFPLTFIGDDAAVLSSLERPLVTTDSFLEGTHFYSWWTSPDKLARRLLEATLSDIAAMGGEPRSILSSIMVPPEMEVEWLLGFYKGLTSREDSPVVGGETVKGPVFGITLTAIGECGTGNPFLRSKVNVGDSIWVTGPIGRSLDSPELLDKGRTAELSELEQEQIEMFLTPRARFDVTRTLREYGVKAAIDVSDGLFSECEHLAGESDAKITVELDLVPLVPYARNNPLKACSAGEDFELLFALPEGASDPGDGFYMIGSVASGKGFVLTNHGTQIETSSLGYDHFS